MRGTVNNNAEIPGITNGPREKGKVDEGGGWGWGGIMIKIERNAPMKDSRIFIKYKTKLDSTDLLHGKMLNKAPTSQILCICPSLHTVFLIYSTFTSQ